MAKQLKFIWVIGSLYILTIVLLASYIEREYPQFRNSVPGYNLEFGIKTRVPPLVRFDAQWYWSIAQHGYQSTAYKNNQYNIAFMPFYPVLIRMVGKLLQINFFYAGLLVAWASLLAGLGVIYKYARSIGHNADQATNTIIAILVFPSAFIFASMYSESLFLLLTAGSLLLYRKKHPYYSAGAAFLATATRTSGLALSGAYVVVAVKKWHQKQKLQYSDFFPIAGPLLVIVLQMIYSLVVFNNPMQYVYAKAAWFQGLGVNWPWVTIQHSEIIFMRFIKDINIMSLNFGFGPVALVFIIIGCVLLWKKRLYLEAGYVTSALLLISLTGTPWGVGRFAVVLFPIFIILAKKLPRYIWQWRIYLLIGMFWQIILLLNYVSATPPTP